MMYVDVLLPVPLQESYTYSLSDEMAAEVVSRSGNETGLGMRLLVPFGKSKTYAAIALRVHQDKPDLDDDKIREVLSLLDPKPALQPQQLRLWRWIASYYMSPLGDVMKAALPAGLKAETGYRPKMETYVAIADKFASEQGQRIAMEMLRRMPKQGEVFKILCGLSQPSLSPVAQSATCPSPNWGGDDYNDKQSTALDCNHKPQTSNLKPQTSNHKPQTSNLKPQITKEALLNEAHCTSAVLKKLIDQGFIKTYELEADAIQNSKFKIQNSSANHKAQSSKLKAQSLSPEQQQAFESIKEQWQQKNVVLLHGVTSSGKTEIYIHLIQEVIAKGQQVLYLLPEIALTVQMTQRLKRVFGDELGIYHSKYSDAERTAIWWKQLSSQPYSVILGARSAVFLPFQNLGLVIVDEEHVQSFKQQDPAPRYHARSVAIVLAQMYKAKTLLGTATPSVESWYNATSGKFGLVTLSHRYKDIQMPEIEVVDTKDLRHRRMMSGPFSPRLLAATRDALVDGKQVILFQNRRGFAPVLSCPVCGWTPKCKNCDVTLTYHKRLNMLTCHYCGYEEPVPEKCPCCGNTHLSDRGYGTEKIEDLVCDLFPEAKVARMDLDTTHTRNAYDRLITEFSEGKTNVLIGTQMVSKGLDFANVAVVGILDADSMLNYPDFRAYEQAFQMMSQVAGRAGRKGKRGLVILQTKEPTLPVIQQVVNNDYKGFFHDALDERTMFNYPPYCHLIYIYLRHKEEGIVEMAAQEMAAILKRSLSPSPSPVGEGSDYTDKQLLGNAQNVLGPDKPAVARVKNLFIRKIVIKVPLGADQRRTRQTLYAVRDGILSQAVYKTVQIYFDVDPE